MWQCKECSYVVTEWDVVLVVNDNTPQAGACYLCVACFKVSSVTAAYSECQQGVTVDVVVCGIVYLLRRSRKGG